MASITIASQTTADEIKEAVNTIKEGNFTTPPCVKSVQRGIKAFEVVSNYSRYAETVCQISNVDPSKCIVIINGLGADSNTSIHFVLPYITAIIY